MISDDEYSIDQLVEGALDGEARRALLGRLEAEPGGWRRLALGFLEAQCWREALGPLAAGGVPEPATSRKPGRPRLLWPLVSAAGLALAFGLGWSAKPAGPPGAATTVAGQPRERERARDRDRPAPGPPAVAAPSRPRSPHRPVVVAAPPLDERPSRPASLPEPLLRKLERVGYRVEPRRGLVALNLDDGRRLAVPVDAVKVRYVGHPVY